MIPSPSLPVCHPPAARAWVRRTALAALAMLAGCVSKPGSEVVVSVKDQKMGIYNEGRLKKQYVISTSKFGLGDEPNSYRTPLGKHEVIAKIGHGLPPGAVLKSRHWNGEVLKPNAPGRDPIVSRILWLRGLENDNRNAMRRYIYIHGTTEESRLGSPASYGCIRMGMKDVVDAFEEVGIGAKVVITKGHLPHGKAPPKPGPGAAPEGGQDAEETTASPEAPAAPTPAAAPAAVAAAQAPANPPMLAEPVEVRRSLFRRLFFGDTTTKVESSQMAEESPVTTAAAPAPVTEAPPPAAERPSFIRRLFFGNSAPVAAETSAPAPATQGQPGKPAAEETVGPVPQPDQVATERAGKDQAGRSFSQTRRLAAPQPRPGGNA